MQQGSRNWRTTLQAILHVQIGGVRDPLLPVSPRHTPEEMAEAALELLRNLTPEDSSFIGLCAEEVSDSEEGTALRVTEPLSWLGQGALHATTAEEGTGQDPATQSTEAGSSQRTENEAVQPRTPATSQEVEKEVLSNVQRHLQNLQQLVSQLM